jgi:hypothetical protein
MAESKDNDANADVHGSGADAGKAERFLPIVYEATAQGAGDGAAADGAEPAEAAASAEASRWRLPASLPIAATIALAAAVGVLAGAATTAALLRDDTAPVALATSRALQDSVDKLGTELAALKTGISTVQRSASTNFGKLAERLDRTEKAQAEPAAKIAKLADSVDKLDRRVAQASTHASTHAASDITGSVPVRSARPDTKLDSRSPVAEGWRLRDFYSGRAVVQSRNGTLFEVGPGSNLPGLGRVETIKREDGKVVVVTRNGIIAASLERRREPYPLPYRY